MKLFVDFLRHSNGDLLDFFEKSAFPLTKIQNGYPIV